MSTYLLFINCFFLFLCYLKLLRHHIERCLIHKTSGAKKKFKEIFCKKKENLKMKIFLCRNISQFSFKLVSFQFRSNTNWLTWDWEPKTGGVLGPLTVFCFGSAPAAKALFWRNGNQGRRRVTTLQKEKTIIFSNNLDPAGYLAVGYYYCIIWVLVRNNVLRGLLMSFILVLSYTKYIPHISYSCVTSVRLMVYHG